MVWFCCKDKTAKQKVNKFAPTRKCKTRKAHNTYQTYALFSKYFHSFVEHYMKKYANIHHKTPKSIQYPQQYPGRGWVFHFATSKLKSGTWHLTKCKAWLQKIKIYKKIAKFVESFCKLKTQSFQNEEPGLTVLMAFLFGMPCKSNNIPNCSCKKGTTKPWLKSLVQNPPWPTFAFWKTWMLFIQNIKNTVHFPPFCFLPKQTSPTLQNETHQFLFCPPSKIKSTPSGFCKVQFFSC